MEIVNWKKNTNANSVMKASFTLKLTAEDLSKYGPLLVDCHAYEKSQSENWFNMGQREYTSKEGKRKFWNMVRWERGNVVEAKTCVTELINKGHPVDDLPF